MTPSIDAVDNGQNKKAVQLADKILKKQDDLHCARVITVLYSMCLKAPLDPCVFRR